MTVRMQKIKDESEINLFGATISLQLADREIEAVVVTDMDGESIRIAVKNGFGNSLNVFRKSDPIEETHISVQGRLVDTNYSESFGKDTFENREAAQAFIEERMCQVNEDAGSLAITTHTVLVEPTAL